MVPKNSTMTMMCDLERVAIKGTSAEGFNQKKLNWTKEEKAANKQL